MSPVALQREMASNIYQTPPAASGVRSAFEIHASITRLRLPPAPRIAVSYRTVAASCTSRRGAVPEFADCHHARRGCSGSPGCILMTVELAGAGESLLGVGCALGHLEGYDSTYQDSRTSQMKFIQVTLALALLVASTYALKCNVGGTSGSTSTCVATDLTTTADTCYSCKVTSAGQTGVIAGGCLAGTGIGKCDTYKAACTADTFKTCTTDNCNSCSPASALQASAVLLLAVAAAMML
jgi:hypothetical protein